jgi:hypothetical protein
MSFDYTHHGRCFECGELAGLNKDTLMCPKHDYAAKIHSLRTRLASAEEALGFYADIESWEATGWDAQDLIDDSDIEEMKGEDLPKGGKRAREHFEKFPPSDK